MTIYFDVFLAFEKNSLNFFFEKWKKIVEKGSRSNMLNKRFTRISFAMFVYVMQANTGEIASEKRNENEWSYKQSLFTIVYAKIKMKKIK